jgi:DNA helicase TIP49 (TBP-interacting protein)
MNGKAEGAVIGFQGPPGTGKTQIAREGIAKCLEILTNDYRFNKELTYFTTHKKKDDLSDSFLQGLWYINKQKL